MEKFMVQFFWLDCCIPPLPPNNISKSDQCFVPNISIQVEGEKTTPRILTKLPEVVDFELKIHHTRFCVSISKGNGAADPQWRRTPVTLKDAI